MKKPDGLPSISQWMDVPADQTANNGHTNNNNTNTATNNGTMRRTRGARDGEGAAANEQRPLHNPMGQFGRRQSMRKSSDAQGIKAAINALFVEPGEETVLGPPKLAFLSARTPAKAAGDAKERAGFPSTDADNAGDRLPKNDRWTRDRENDRTRDKGYTNGRRAPRDDGEGWTNVKGRKSLGQEDFERFGRNGDRNRDKHEGDPEADMAPRRNNNRDRNEPRWGRRDEGRDEGAKTGAPGGWRERERDRERDSGRDWNRGGNRGEDDPEWMDTKVEKKEFKPRTQEDFQRWKEQMRAKDTPAGDKDESRETPAEMSSASAIAPGPMLTAPLHTPSAAEPTQGILFGNWGRDKSAEMPPPEIISAKPRPDKKSRFMTMFAKPEESASPIQPPEPYSGSPAPPVEANADKEGFQRILQMLGQVSTGGSPAPQPQTSMPTPPNGMRHGGGISLDFHQQSPPPDPQHGRPPPPRTLEQQSILENILAPRPTDSRIAQQARFNGMPSENTHPDQFRLARPGSGHPEEHYAHQPPPQRTISQDANLTALLNSRAREESQRDQATKQRERDFLLNLMQQPSRSTPPQAQAHNLPRPAQENPNMAFFDQQRQQPPPQGQQQPKGRGGPPPGFMEDPRMFTESEMLRRDAADRREQMEIRQLQQMQQQEAMRSKNPRMPMGFPNPDESLMGLQRRNTGGDPRMPTNMGIPSQPTPDMQYMGGRGQPGMPPTPQERPNIAPPPGFGGPMRQPPGLGGPTPPQMGPGGPSFSAGNTPLGHPPGFPPGGNIRGLGFPGGPGGPGGNGMQGPPGYFPPPGYGGPPIPGMRGGDDPRLMFDGQFGGLPRQQPGRPGPPNMY